MILMLIMNLIVIRRIIKIEIIRALEQISNMTFLRNEFSKVFDILFTTPIYREDAYLSSNDELKIKAKDLRSKLMAVKCSIEKYINGLTNPFRKRGWSDCWYKKKKQ